MTNRVRRLWQRLTAASAAPIPGEASAQLHQNKRDQLRAAGAEEPKDERGRSRRQAALLRLSAELAATMEESEICHRVVDGLRETLDYDVVALFLLDQTTGNRVLTASVGYEEPVSHLPPGRGLSERPLLDGELHYSPDVSTEPRYFYGMDGSEVDVPIRIGGKVLGVLTAESVQREAFNESDFEVLTAAAQQAGLAIEKARSLEAERRRANELDALRTTLADITAELELPALLKAIVERAAALLDATGGELGLYDETCQEIRIVVSHNLGSDYVGTRHRIGEGAMGRVVETGEPLIIDDYDTWHGGLPQYTDIHATLAAPLKVGERLVGVFTTVSTDPSRQFGADDLHLLNLFGQQAAIAIENARLYDQAQREIAERRKVEEEIRRQKEYFEALFVNNPVAVATANLHGTVISWNPMAERLFGYTQEEAIGSDLNDLVANHDTIRAEANRFSDEVIQLGRVQASTRRTRKDGSLVDVELLALPVVVAEETVGFIAIYVDITDLQEARRGAEAANRAKSAFLANMSHELRSPLSVILGFAQLMEDAPGLTDTQRDNLRIINQSGEHLLTLINDVLEMSKIEAGRVTMQETSTDLHGLLDVLKEVFALRAARKGLELKFEREETVPQYVQVDEGKLRQVLLNLLGNAVKFTQEGTVEMRVTGSRSGPQCSKKEMVWLHFEVKDTGPGIPLKDQAVVFEPFVQARRERQSQEGTGLGLSISQKYVRMMGGDITLTSKVGQGSVFQFEIQVHLADPDHVQAEHPSRRVIGLEPGQPTYRILVVDESDTGRQLLVKLLTGLGPPPQGFEVREAINGQEAVEVWKQWEPHLIWMDMQMPVMDGYEATRRIKALPKGQDCVIVALTASAFDEDRERAQHQGCDAFVGKPFRKHEIFDTLAEHLGVRFVYKDLPVPPSQPGRPLTDAQDVAALQAAAAALPRAVVADLQEATVEADLGRISALIDQIRGIDDTLGDALASLARDFDHDAILTLIQPGTAPD